LTILLIGNLGMTALAKAARKIGLGLRAGEGTEGAVDDWIGVQLASAESRRLAIATNTVDAPDIVEWPAALTFDLPTRIDRMLTLRAEADRIDKAGLEQDAYEEARYQNWLKYTMQTYDEYRFANMAVYGADQLKQRLMHFWLNHFTVGAKETTPELIGDYYEAIYACLDGSFADLLYRVETHPAMLTYLDNIYNIGYKSEKARGCDFDGCVIGLNDNLARELLELHTVSPARGYTETDIHEGAKVLAGWGDIFDLKWQKPPKDWSKPWHSFHAEPGIKTVLGTEIPDGQKGLRVLTDMLAADAATPRYISGKLARHFIGDTASDADIAAIERVWLDTGGHLPAVHQKVLSLAVASPTKRFHWPLTWLFQLLRISDATLLRGFEDIRKPLVGVSDEPDQLMREIGNSFWAERQPNGYSDRRADWISTEHFDRRIRLADIVFTSGAPRLGVDEIMQTHGFSEATAELVGKGTDDKHKFILFACSPEMMEV